MSETKLIKVETMPYHPIAKYTFKATPCRSMAYVKILTYIASHPLSSIGEIIPNALDKQIREYDYSWRANYPETKHLPRIEHHWPDNSILPAIRKAGLVVAYRIRGNGLRFHYEITDKGIALLSQVK